MTIILREIDRDGKVVKQCDAKCYDGTESVCRCCCYGVNHGVGLEQARRNAKTSEITATQPWLPYDHPDQTYIVPHGKVFGLRQRSLFDVI